MLVHRLRPVFLAALACALAAACTGNPDAAPSASQEPPAGVGGSAATGTPAAPPSTGAGPTPDGGAEPVEWSMKVCTALSAWSSELSAQGAMATAALEGAESVEEAASGLEGLLAAAQESTDDLVAALQDAGDPAVGSGAEIGGEVREAAEDARAALSDLAAQVAEAPADDAEEFAATTRQIVDGYAAATASVGRRIDEASDRYPSPELDAAGAAAPSCVVSVSVPSESG